MSVIMVLVIEQNVYGLSATNQVVDAVFDLLWQHQERGGHVVLGA